MDDDLPTRDELPVPISMAELRSGAFKAKRRSSQPPASGRSVALVQRDSRIPRTRSSLRPGRREKPRSKRRISAPPTKKRRSDADTLFRWCLLLVLLSCGLSIIALGMSAPPTHLVGLEMMFGGAPVPEDEGWDPKGVRLGQFFAFASLLLLVPTLALGAARR
ncbi:MAG: hypothetical protein AAGH15_17965 [Myxococcota bacterium]